MMDYILENGLKSVLFWIVGLLTVWAAFALGLNSTSDFPPVPGSQWQAVFLSNGQVYFGKLDNYDINYVTLSDVYYLRTASELNSTGASNLNLIKLGGEVHGPQDTMYIPKSNLLYWENMKDDSRVVQTINSTKQQ